MTKRGVRTRQCGTCFSLFVKVSILPNFAHLVSIPTRKFPLTRGGQRLVLTLLSAERSKPSTVPIPSAQFQSHADRGFSKLVAETVVVHRSRHHHAADTKSRDRHGGVFPRLRAAL